MLLGPGINAAMQTAIQLKMKHSQLNYSNSQGSINNVEVKDNISAGFCGSLAQLQRKLL